MYLALDVGDRYIGLAATDSDGRLTYRYGTVDRQAVDPLVEIRRVVEKEKVEVVVAGMPLGLKGQETQQTKKTRRFVAALKAALPAGVRVEEISEVLSSMEAARNLEAEGGRQEAEHAEAARILLEDYIKQAGKQVTW